MMESVAWPWTAAAWAALGRSELPALLSLAAWTLLAAWFGRTQFERNLRFDAVAAQATPQTNGISPWQAAAEAFYRFPARCLRDPLAAIVEKELRSLARTPRYRMVFVMGFLVRPHGLAAHDSRQPGRPQFHVVPQFSDRWSACMP